MQHILTNLLSNAIKYSTHADPSSVMGTGLGLTIVQTHRGAVSFVSELGKGTTFVVVLP